MLRSTGEVRRSSVVLDRLKPQEGKDVPGKTKKKRKYWPLPQIFWFAIVSGLAGALVNAIFTFFPSVMTTLEKRFNINNQRLSYILLANDISAICIGPFSTYYLAKRHIPRSLCFVLLMMMCYSFIIASPHFLYGSGETAMSFVKENISVLADTQLINPNMSTVGGLVESSKLCGISTGTLNGVESKPTPPVVDFYFTVLVIFFVAHFICGIADSIFWSLLLTYMDNNVSKSKAPIVHSISMVIRLCGILLGNTMNNLGLQIYINPFVTPSIDYTDPRWIGAWWFTPTILGFLFIIPAILISRFPAKIRNKESVDDVLKEIPLIPQNEEKPEEQVIEEKPIEKPSLKDMWTAYKRLLRNKIVLYSILSYIARRFAGLPFNTYMVKYMEQLYNIPTADANGYIAKYDTPSIIVGVLLSGFFTTKIRPTARQLQAFSMLVTLLLVISTFGYIFYGCDQAGSELSSVNNLCTSNCACEDIKFSPICGSNNFTYNSPCEAGCRSYNEWTESFEDCSCIVTDASFSSGNQSVGGFGRDGPCKSEMCTYPFYFFLVTQAVTNFLAACTWTTATIIALRAVDVRDKAICLSLYEVVGSILVSIPGPLILSRLLDSICVRRDIQSSETTHCWVYDRQLFSYAFNGSSAVFLLFSIVFSGMGWIHMKDMQIFDKKEKKAEAKDVGLITN